MLCADERSFEPYCLLVAVLNHLSGAGRICALLRQLYRLIRRNQLAYQFRHFFYLYSAFIQHSGGNSCSFLQKTDKQVFGSHIGMAQSLRRIYRQANGLSGFCSKTIYHTFPPCNESSFVLS